LVCLLLWPSLMYSRKFGVRLRRKWWATKFGKKTRTHVEGVWLRN